MIVDGFQIAADLGHNPAPVDWTKPRVRGSFECTNPGCNMGATIDVERPEALRVTGAAVSYLCPSWRDNNVFKR